jgi:uridylate kinase
MGCDALLKGTSVDGVYTADPKKDPHAKRYERLTYLDVLTQDLKVMDASAISMMRESRIPIVVFSIRERGALSRVLSGQGVYTTIAEQSANCSSRSPWQPLKSPTWPSTATAWTRRSPP